MKVRSVRLPAGGAGAAGGMHLCTGAGRVTPEWLPRAVGPCGQSVRAACVAVHATGGVAAAPHTQLGWLCGGLSNVMFFSNTVPLFVSDCVLCWRVAGTSVPMYGAPFLLQGEGLPSGNAGRA